MRTVWLLSALFSFALALEGQRHANVDLTPPKIAVRLTPLALSPIEHTIRLAASAVPMLKPAVY